MRWARFTITLDQFARMSRLPAMGGGSPRAWLSTAEAVRFEESRATAAKVRWLGGRWCAKQLVVAMVDDPAIALSDIHIESRDGQHRQVRPRVFLRGRLQPWKLSIAHSTHGCAAAILNESTGHIGVDIATPGAVKNNRLVDYWFCDAEKKWCDAGIDATVLWSLKEAVYKALNRGETFRPRTINMTDWMSFSQCQHICDHDSSDEFHLSIPRGGSLVCRRLSQDLATFVVMAGPKCRLAS